MRKILALSLLALAGCSEGQREASPSFPAGTKAFVVEGNRYTWIVPVEVNGTKCITALVNGNHGGGISCDWK